jgi:hypothetical protein
LSSKEIGLKISVEKTKHILLSCHQNAEQINGIKTPNESLENVITVQIQGPAKRPPVFGEGAV